MKKEFSGYDLKSLIEEIDQWLISNQAAFYGSKPMILHEVVTDDGKIHYIITIKYVYY